MELAVAAGLVVGRGLHLRVDGRRVLLRLVHHRRVLAPDPRLASHDKQDHYLGAVRTRAVAVHQAAHECGVTTSGLLHHSDAGSQYTSLAFTEELQDAGITGSIGSVGDALDNALIESAIGLFEAEVRPRTLYLGVVATDRAGDGVMGALVQR